MGTKAESIAYSKIISQLKVFADKMETDLARHDGAEHAEGYLVGDGYTLADIAGTVFCAVLHVYLREDFVFFTKPRVSKYWLRMKSRPSFRDAKLFERFEDCVFHSQVMRFRRDVHGFLVMLVLLVGAFVYVALFAQFRIPATVQ